MCGVPIGVHSTRIMFPKDAEIEANVTAAIIVMYTNPKLREPRVKCSLIHQEEN